MKRLVWMAVTCLLAVTIAHAQSPAADPVSATLRQVLDRYANNLVATAEEVPAEKYSYHPTAAQMTIGQTMLHVADVNNSACSKVTGDAAPERLKIPETDKDKLVEALKASMDFCKQAFAKLSDAKLGDPVTMFNGRQGTRFSAALEVTNDLIDHYAALAVYLRLNDLLPPTAQRKK
jgi:uncharacterized damage-inducible protein DinB